jgi:hypothetical protein
MVLLLARAAVASDAPPRFELKAGDVVAFVGGETVVAQGENGHLESLLAAAFPSAKAKFRNLAWEADTVFDRPRDLNFPSVERQLKSVGATVIFVEFGRSESAAGEKGLPAFVEAYGKLCDELAKQTRRIVIASPAPFGKPGDARLPDLSARNENLAKYVAATRELASRCGFYFVDVFTALRHRGGLTTSDGLRLTPRGCADVATATVFALGVRNVFAESDAHGAWKSPAVESVRQAVVEKNRLWFEYSRPMNWAFLGGDRQFVPSSRDPKDLKVRVFPREMERFAPLIDRADAKVHEVAVRAGSGK